jgi:DNA-binding FadR family transcriptional regulator
LRLGEAMAADGDDLERMARHDIAFHEAIARASHNALFVRLLVMYLR